VKGGDSLKMIKLEVWGDFAVFTRPETKVERFSYPVMTPSAARGILDAIYSKPVEFGWRVDCIEVLNPISFIPLRRNEVKEKISVRQAVGAANGGEPPLILADATSDITGGDTKGRTQRQTMALKNVRYRIHARIQPRRGFEAKQAAFEDQALRRIENGKCFYQPFMGCREFVAYFEPAGDLPAINTNLDIGYMLYDVFDLDQVVIGYAKPFVSLFRAKLENGVLHVPDWNSSQVRKPPKQPERR